MKRVLLTLLAAGWFTAAYAQDKALLYEVSGKDLARPSYLYGTFHLVCPADLQLTDAIRKAMADTQQLYLEIDLDDPALTVAMMKATLLSDGKTLKDFLKPEDYNILDAYLQRTVGRGLAQMAIFKPIMLTSALVIDILKCQPVSYDQAFADLARQEKKEVLGLETIEEQMAALDRIPIEQQLEELIALARNPEEARKELLSMVAAYRTQDLPRLMKLALESQFDPGSAFEEELLDKRNKNWVPTMEKAARAKSTFFAFGAGHLAGANGVVNLLRQRGYTVKPIQ